MFVCLKLRVGLGGGVPKVKHTLFAKLKGQYHHDQQGMESESYF